MDNEDAIDAMPLTDITKEWLRTPEGADFFAATVKYGPLNPWPMQFPEDVLTKPSESESQR